jgi:hypothetical protein
MEIGPGIFFARTLDEKIFKEEWHETGTGTNENDSSVNQVLGWLPDCDAGNHDVFQTGGLPDEKKDTLFYCCRLNVLACRINGG